MYPLAGQNWDFTGQFRCRSKIPRSASLAATVGSLMNHPPPIRFGKLHALCGHSHANTETEGSSTMNLDLKSLMRGCRGALRPIRAAPLMEKKPLLFLGAVRPPRVRLR